MRGIEVIHATGHENILSTNRTTFEITKDPHLTKQGDCIIAVNADKAARDLNPEFRQILRSENAQVTITIQADTEEEAVNAHGNPQLTLMHPTDLVVRKSSFISNRTLAVGAGKAAIDLSRSLVKKLQNPKQKVIITLIGETL